MDPDQVTVRPFRPDDQSRARHLILTGLGEHFGYIDETLNPDLDDIQSQYPGSGHPFVVAESNGYLVGTGGLRLKGQASGEVVRVSVCKGYRGQGIGRRIVEHLVALARARGVRQLLAETNLDWIEAIALYRSCGFVEHGRDEVSVYLRRELTEVSHDWGNGIRN